MLIFCYPCRVVFTIVRHILATYKLSQAIPRLPLWLQIRPVEPALYEYSAAQTSTSLSSGMYRACQTYTSVELTSTEYSSGCRSFTVLFKVLYSLCLSSTNKPYHLFCKLVQHMPSLDVHHGYQFTTRFF